jgi:hypothetical protein
VRKYFRFDTIAYNRGHDAAGAPLPALGQRLGSVRGRGPAYGDRQATGRRRADTTPFARACEFANPDHARLAIRFFQCGQAATSGTSADAGAPSVAAATTAADIADASRIGAAAPRGFAPRASGAAVRAASGTAAASLRITDGWLPHAACRQLASKSTNSSAFCGRSAAILCGATRRAVSSVRSGGRRFVPARRPCCRPIRFATAWLGVRGRL